MTLYAAEIHAARDAVWYIVRHAEIAFGDLKALARTLRCEQQSSCAHARVAEEHRLVRQKELFLVENLISAAKGGHDGEDCPASVCELIGLIFAVALAVAVLDQAVFRNHDG